MIEYPPIYRARIIGSNRWVEGYLTQTEMYSKKYVIQPHKEEGETSEYRIDMDSLSIHLPNMIDNKGNKVFASFDPRGRGGDLILYRNKHVLKTVLVESRVELHNTKTGRKYFCNFSIAFSDNMQIIGRLSKGLS